MITFEKFKENCEKNNCLRNTLITKPSLCKKDYKQETCYRKYTRQQEKKIKKESMTDERWKETVKIVWERDKGKCQIWEILTTEQKQFILEIYPYEYSMMMKTIDPAHIETRGSNKALKYDPDNVVLVARFFHSLLDTLRHPVTQSPITKEERKDWFIRALLNSKRNNLK